MNKNNWETKVKTELAQAQAARAMGNEGRARVCARRAAGIALGEYLRKTGHPSPGPSAIDRLYYLVDLPSTSAVLRQRANYLTLRVNEDHELPAEVDLITEANLLIQALFPTFSTMEAQTA